MRKLLVFTSLFLLLLLGFALAQNPAPTNQAAPTNSRLKTQADKASYAVGMSIGDNMRRQGAEIDPDLLLQGLKDFLAGKPLMTQEEAHAALLELQKASMAKKEAKRQQAAETNKQEGEAFLATNKTKPGIVTLPSGLQYKIITAGTGPMPASTDTVACNYRGTLINGTEFDSSYKRGQPLTIQVGGVIKGWTEALQLMPVGSKWQLFIPSNLAYGERGAGEDIGPDATLIFEVELISIQDKQDKQDKQGKQ
jgi:FKBP-type peptidyl-prolyl cis-trans isomerase FklB